MKECLFCQIAKGKIYREKINEKDKFFSILDDNQKIPGHCLILSKKHFTTTFDIPKELGEKLLDCIQQTAKRILEKEKATGFNIVNNNFKSAKQVIDHVHFHILPRKDGDKVPLVY